MNDKQRIRIARGNWDNISNIVPYYGHPIYDNTNNMLYIGNSKQLGLEDDSVQPIQTNKLIPAKSSTLNIDTYVEARASAIYINGPSVYLTTTNPSNGFIVNGKVTINDTATLNDNLIINGKITTNELSITSGNIILTGANSYVQATYFNATSDKRLKENIVNIDIPALDVVKSINIKEYNLIGSKETQLGLLAQDLLEKDRDRLFIDDSQEYLKVKENKLIYLLWKAIQELSDKVGI